MSLEKAIKEMKFDSRLSEHNLRAGTLTEEELKKHLEALPDLAEKCEKLELEVGQKSRVEQH